MDKEWHMKIKGLGILRVSYELVESLKGYRQLEKGTPESGGTLIGMHLNSGGKFLINEYTPPQTSDKQGRHLYHRSETHTKLILDIWKESKRTLTYIGLWHTHPEPIPTYSAIDKNDWNNSLNKSIFTGDRLFFFIVGQTHIRCWMGTKKLFKNKIELLGELNVK